MKYEGYYVTFNKSVECLKDISRIDIHQFPLWLEPGLSHGETGLQGLHFW